MEKLLHWSIANSQGDKEAIAKAGQPDPKLLQQLFGGGMADDPTLMKESMTIVLSPEVELDNKMIAMDNFEMLIENLDNANNIENLKLWDPLLEVLSFEEAELRATALSIIGTAVQNNPTSQDNFLKHEGGLEKIIHLINDSTQPIEVKIKALYALSNLLRNHADMAKKFEEMKGLDIIAPILTDKSSNTKLKMRTISLLTAFLSCQDITEQIISTLRADGAVCAAIHCLNTESDLNILDRVLHFLSQLISSGLKFNESEIKDLTSGFKKIEPLEDRLNEDDFLAVKYVL
ncbi:hypothetical protein KAFR_0G01690 [Kazachstania africana CBS 2517]|uniref:Hsp70 nucleotide exchange factor FES1 n=1 Tax=Kazachstania africana (strain ATCC 22294 / BCRC 22015 / CBS 2517 / CECT 1963 / NBRC 1671 / NRRL Y-8276) TaxID=1071382 RepID=H2AXV3_KAZAF|nr:hypothetical protein KAFR_0G01690 [Kazachstania africana CBS 2517]CCF59203.1 hypothetical protein KAFR_0G01690 [Kazachstania africana CBS 2517]